MPALAANDGGEVDNTFGGWESIEVTHWFNKRVWGLAYFEHDNYQYKRLECWYARAQVGYKFTPWLKGAVAMDYLKEPGSAENRYVFDLVETIKEGNLSVQVRERYIHSIVRHTHEPGNVLRVRLKATYAVPRTMAKPYMAMEVFQWDVWKKTRHYLGVGWQLTPNVLLDTYYLYYTFNGAPAEHIIGFEIDLEI